MKLEIICNPGTDSSANFMQKHLIGRDAEQFNYMHILITNFLHLLLLPHMFPSLPNAQMPSVQDVFNINLLKPSGNFTYHQV
jgi:hypothetical protein